MSPQFLTVGLLALASSSALSESPPKSPSSCEVVRLRVPAPDVSSSRIRYMKRDTALYLAAFLSSTPLPNTSDDSEFFVNLGCFENLSPALQTAIQKTGSNPASLEPYPLRNVIGEVFLETRHLRHTSFDLPERVEDFEALTQFRNWWGQVIFESRVKGLTRALYHSPGDFPVEISVAVTHESTSGDLSAPRRETEVIIKRSPNTRDWDFYSYDESGQLQPHSEFRRGPAPSPSVCMSCHYEPATRSFAPMLRPMER